jgi:hypothetical protein
MQNFALRSVAVATTAIALTLPLAGCGNDSKDSSSSSAKTSTAATSSNSAKPTKTGSKIIPRTTDKPDSGSNQTIADYIKAKNITEVIQHPGDAGSPTLDLPVPENWKDASADAPEWAYGAIVYDGADAGAYTASVLVLMSKLTGDVDADKLIQYASGELKNLPGYEPLGDGAEDTLDGFQGYELAGNYTSDDGEKLVSAQKTVIVPADDGVFIIQFNVDGADEQLDVLKDVTAFIDDNVKITPA